MALKIQILPSLLAADVGHLADGVRMAEDAGADGLHIDIMDGHLAPTLSMGPPVVAMARRCSKLHLNVHLMLSNPGRHIEAFAGAGADTIAVHVEADGDIADVLRRIRALGVRPAVTMKPATPADAVRDLLELCDEVLVMSVNPGYGGQAFIPEALPKIRALRGLARAAGRGFDISVDGGIDLGNAERTAEQGANVFIAGTALYSAGDNMPARVAEMREATRRAFDRNWR